MLFPDVKVFFLFFVRLFVCLFVCFFVHSKPWNSLMLEKVLVIVNVIKMLRTNFKLRMGGFIRQLQNLYFSDESVFFPFFLFFFIQTKHEVKEQEADIISFLIKFW